VSSQEPAGQPALVAPLSHGCRSGLLNLCCFPVSARSPAPGAPISRDIIRSRRPRARRSWCYPAPMPSCSGLWAARMARPMGLGQQQVTLLPGWAPAVPRLLSTAQRGARELTGGSWRLLVSLELGGVWARSARALTQQWGWGKDQLPPFTAWGNRVLPCPLWGLTQGCPVVASPCDTSPFCFRGCSWGRAQGAAVVIQGIPWAVGRQLP